MSRDQWRVSSHTSINGKETISLLTVQLLWLFTYSTVMKGLAYLDKGHRFPNLWDSGTSIVLVHPTVGTTGTNNAENTQMVLVVWIFKFFLKYYAEPHSWRSPGPSGRLGGVPTPLAPTLVRKHPNLTTLIAPPPHGWQAELAETILHSSQYASQPFSTSRSTKAPSWLG